jgi:hypothetical protein
MSIVECKECFKNISSKADACPHCGFKKKKIGCLGVIGYGIVGLFLVGVFANYASDSKKNDLAAKSAQLDQESLAKMTPDQRQLELKRRSDIKEAEESQKAKEKKDSSNRAFMAYQSLKALRSSLRDPDSLQIESLNVDEIGTVVCIDYRAKNGFGGYDKSYVTFVKGSPSKSSEAWNANCRNPMYDYKHVKNMK